MADPGPRGGAICQRGRASQQDSRRAEAARTRDPGMAPRSERGARSGAEKQRSDGYQRGLPRRRRTGRPLCCGNQLLIERSRTMSAIIGYIGAM